MQQLIPVKTESQIGTVAALAAEIWSEHYASILSRGQIDYMLEHFQSYDAIRRQIAEDGYVYYLLGKLDGGAGYIAVREENDALFLSKLYVRKRFRGLHFAADTMAYLRGYCRARGLHHIYLTVNKRNTGSIAFYRRQGFRTVRSQMSDIGGGYVMDDYVMELPADEFPESRPLIFR